ncbi:MAG TPA: SPOR domain-containing protein [Chlorobaculum sp.]|nr:SPOR domain-containing protein [Chlorobaculum sp.]
MQQARRTLLTLTLLITCLFFSGQRTTAVAADYSHASKILQYVREDKVYLLEKIRHQITKPSEKLVVEALLSEDGPKAASLYKKQLAEHPDPLIDPISRSRLAAFEKAVATTAAPSVIQSKSAPASRQAPIATAANQAPTPAASRPDSAARKLSAAPASRPTASAKTATTTSSSAKPAASNVPAPASKPDSASRSATQSAATKTPPAEKQATIPARQQAPAPAKTAASSGFTLQFGSFDSVANANQLASQLSASAPATVQQINGIYKVRLKNIFATREEAAAFARTLPIESFVVTIQP